MKSRKSSFDVDNAVNIISGVVFASVLLAVLLLVIAIIFGLDIFVTYGLNESVTTIRGNVVDLVSNFFALMPTVGTILAVVVLIAGIVLLVMYVSNMRRQSGSTAGGAAMTG